MAPEALGFDEDEDVNESSVGQKRSAPGPLEILNKKDSTQASTSNKDSFLK